MRRKNPQNRYLSQAIQLEESLNPAIIRSTILVVSAALLTFLGWAALTNINEIARTPGEILPLGHVQIVQHLEGGMVKSINVQEGENVQKGQILLTLDDSGSRDDLNRALLRQDTLEMQEERLRAFSEGRKPDFSRFAGINADQTKDQDMFFKGMIDARQEEYKIIKEQILQKKRAISTLQADLQTARNNHAIIKDLHDRRYALNQKGYVSDMQFLETKQNLVMVEGDIRQVENRIAVARAEISEFEKRLSSLGAQRLDEAYGRLDQIIAEKTQNAETIERLKNRVARLDVRAPAGGLVKGLDLTTIGAVVTPGQNLMEIVPLDKDMVVQVKIAPQHIGHLKPGQNVEVKFSSFDFSRYGFVPGKLNRISATTFSGVGGERYYQGEINLEKNYVGDNPANLVMPGMTVMADIVTGEKTILDYLLKPIQRAVQTAFNER